MSPAVEIIGRQFIVVDPSNEIVGRYTSQEEAQQTIENAQRSNQFDGTVCPICKRPISIDWINLQPNAHLGDLRQRLSEQGWQDKTINCSDPDCNSAKIYGLNDLIFLDYSNWLHKRQMPLA